MTGRQRSRLLARIAEGVAERRRTARRQAAHQEVTRILARAHSLAEAVPPVLRAIGEGFGFSWGALWRGGRRARLLICAGAWSELEGAGAFEAEVHRSLLLTRPGFPASAWLLGRPEALADLDTPAAPQRYRLAARAGLRSACAFPIVDGEQVVGLLELASHDAVGLDPQLVAAMATIGGQLGRFAAARAAERERAGILTRERQARAEAERAADQLARLHAVTDAALASLSTDDLLRESVERVRLLLPADGAAILLSAGEERLEVRAASGAAAEVLAHSAGAGLLGRIARSRAAEQIDDVVADQRAQGERWPDVRSLLGAPITLRDRSLGVVVVTATRPRAFGADGAQLLRLMADRIGRALERLRLHEAERVARAQAEIAGRVKDEFVSAVSHELRTPLTAMLGWVELLAAGGLDAAQRAHAIEVISRNIRAQSRLVDDLLDVSRIASGKLHLEWGEVDLARVVAAAVDLAQPAARSKGVRLEARLSADVPPIAGDGGRLQQAVWNLLSNAIKFTPAGGRVDVALERRGREVEVVVRDTGCGIPRERLAYIFDRLRVPDVESTRRAAGGLGLGLAIVRHLVELHAGTVEAESDGEGRGATLRLRLPMRSARERPAEPLPGPVPPAAEAAPARLDGVRAVIVEDEADVREMLVATLRRSGAEVRDFGAAAEAAEAIARDPPDVIVSDIAMPGEDGHSLIRRVRALDEPRAARVPAIALTAFARREDRLRALAAGFDEHLAKPVDPARLVARIAAHLGGRTPAIAPPQETPASPEPPRRPRVLVVEDDPDLADAARLLISELPVTVETAADGEQALAKVEAWRPDAILLDLTLPGLSGVEVMRALDLRREGAPRVIVMSARAIADVRAVAEEAGAFAWIGKPFDRDALEDVVRRACDLASDKPAAAPRPRHPRPRTEPRRSPS